MHGGAGTGKARNLFLGEHMDDGIFPIDTKTLNKGDYLSPEWCEVTTGVDRSEPDYRFALLDLKATIIRNSIDDGRPLSCVIRGDGLYVQHDNEASVYHDKRAGAGVRLMARGLASMSALVDPSRLTERELDTHTRSQSLRALQVQAVRGATRIAYKEMRAPSSGEADPGDAGPGLDGRG